MDDGTLLIMINRKIMEKHSNLNEMTDTTMSRNKYESSQPVATQPAQQQQPSPPSHPQATINPSSPTRWSIRIVCLSIMIMMLLSLLVMMINTNLPSYLPVVVVSLFGLTMFLLGHEVNHSASVCVSL